MGFAIETGQKVLFTGDSITDCGRRGEHRPLGCGYARMAVDLIDASMPDLGATFLNTGIGGNTVRDLFDRWTDDCIALAPDWLSILIGINDNHRWLSGADTGVGPEEYAGLYERILARAREETSAKLVLLTPFYMSTARPGEADGWRGRVMASLPDYIATVERLAEAYDARLVRLHEMFQRHLETRRADEFGNEPVHPNQTGHLLIAHEWLRTMGW